MDERRLLLTDDLWATVEAQLAGLKSKRGAPPDLPDRDFVEAVLYLARTGLPWRDLPQRFGHWAAVYMRFRRWLTRGIWAGLLKQLSGTALARVKVLFVDSTVIRAHAHAAGARKKAVARRLRGSAGVAAVSPARSTPPSATRRRRPRWS